MGPALRRRRACVEQGLMRMRVEVFDAIVPPRTLLLDDGRQRLAAIIDGAGSWGSGRAAADLAREVLRARWSQGKWSLAAIADDVRLAAQETPAALREDLDWTFSVTVL